MARKARNGKNGENGNYRKGLENNRHAMEEGPKVKSWSVHDLSNITPLTYTQKEFFRYWFEGNNICAYGTSGTGKSLLALYLALSEVLHKRQSKIILVRSAVPTRDIGYLPGTLEEKISEYELPYHDIFWELIGYKNSYNDMKDAGLVAFITTSFIRGITWDNAIVVVEEGQNLTFHEINSVMTRIGENTRVIFTGDIVQTDLDGSKRTGTCGMQQFLNVINAMNKFVPIQFTSSDIVRSDFVKEWIEASESVMTST